LQLMRQKDALKPVCKNLRPEVQSASYVENDFLRKQVITCPFSISAERLDP
jgi:hypothetical protein